MGCTCSVGWVVVGEGVGNSTDLVFCWFCMVQMDQNRNPKILNVQILSYVYPLFCPRSYELGPVCGLHVLSGVGFGWGEGGNSTDFVIFWFGMVQMNQNRNLKMINVQIL